jgi:UDP-N-acetylglucosamine--N-acetylmuramyl-(pentapeptide) pyrophosphoryl-undecaprenol N-acetylglucosamine transferase
MAGGTGGHVFPALAVAVFLQQQGWQVSWLGTPKGLESRVVPSAGIEVDWLSVSGLRGKGLFAKFLALFKFVRSCIEALIILRKRRPHVVLGMGGFVAAPGGLISKILGIPLVIHEQNRVVGTTNRFLSRLASKNLEGFPNTFPKKLNAICTGNPLRQSFLDSMNEYAPPIYKGTVNILIVGGSQGAKILNEIVPQALALLETEENIQVCHQTGNVMQEEVITHYKSLNLQAKVFAFIDDMVSAYQWADLIICRAGAMTVSEVAAMGVPAIFIPLPSAIDDHQTANAMYLSEAKAATLINQKDLTPAMMAQQINLTLHHRVDISARARSQAFLDATTLVAQVCMSEANV